MASIKTILVALDFEPASYAALDWAIDLASQLGAGVTLFHSYDVPIIGIPDGAFIATPQIAAAMATAAQQKLSEAIETRRARGVPLTSLLRQGGAWQSIGEAADEVDAGLVVVGTHGRHGLSHALLGSIAEKTVRTAKRPVAVIHAPA